MFSRADLLVVDASFLGVTGGTLDVYLQRKITTNAWQDWIHFPQVTAGTSKRFSLVVNGEGGAIADVGGGSDASPGVALAANTNTNCLPGDDVRIVFVAGASTSAGAACTVTITPYTERT